MKKIMNGKNEWMTWKKELMVRMNEWHERKNE